MTQPQKTRVLIILGLSDLACFAVANIGYGEIWNGIGVFGLVLFLALFELL